MTRLAVLCLLVSACFADEPDRDPFDNGDGAAQDDAGADESPAESEGGSSSGGEPAEPYGPCETAEDCPIVAGVRSPDSPEARCYQGTCSYRCEVNGQSSDQACPLEDTTEEPYQYQCQDTWCVVMATPWGSPTATCPEGMLPGNPDDVPFQGCVWEPSGS